MVGEPSASYVSGGTGGSPKGLIRTALALAE
jgi:hypothetical protein